MTLKNLNKAPFPWFGGKSKAAPLVWSLLGDVDHYVEPFFGSGAVLLNRPHPCNRAYYSETVNDLDGFVVNAWRAIQWHPEETAAAASWPVTEADKTARQAYLLRWRDEKVLDLLAGSPEWCDPRMAGWWLWSVCCQIGAFNGDGAWIADPVSGRLIKQPRAPLSARSRGTLTLVPSLVRWRTLWLSGCCRHLDCMMQWTWSWMLSWGVRTSECHWMWTVGGCGWRPTRSTSR